MDWQAFGFRGDPLNTSPITKSTLELFTGHRKEIQICTNALSGSNVCIVIEGARGVGTTSFANYLRFSAAAKKIYFTPRTEIKIEQGWRSETLLAAIISNFVREIELLPNNGTLTSDQRFQSAKSLSTLIAETYRAFGVDAFGFGASYSKQAGIVTQPIIVPSPTLGHHLEDLIALIREAGYKNGVLLQLNNLDIGEIHSQEEMKYLFNALRDYTQIDGSSWLFVGDLGLRRFIAQNVDRLDDIISYEIKVNPIPLSDLSEMIDKRVRFYRESDKVELPIEKEVFYYLYKITGGRLRYVFGLMSRLMSRLYVGDLTDKVTLDIAKPMLMKLGKDRVERSDLTVIEEQVLRLLVTLPDANLSNIAKKLKKTSQYIGRVLAKLADEGLVLSQKIGKQRIYKPSIDATIAYTEIS
jgi:DNA-binding transcriptional ArsR family regulator